MIPRPEYPKPQFERKSWMNLNGEWAFCFDNGRSGEARTIYETDEAFDRTITVPFCVESALSGTDTARYLGEALQASNRLAESERYAMALAASGYEIDPASLPNALRTVTLTAEDEALSGEERLKKAMDLVFDETYQTYKQTIRDDIARCEKALLGETEDARQRGSQQLGMALTVQALLLMLLVMVVIVIVLCNGRLVFQPIEALVQAINKDVTTEESGAHELRIVARAYNQALAENQQNQERLAYRATHDALTGLYNRGAFEQARQRTRGRAQAMLIIDVDRFKIFNDEYGHDMGDRVLQKVASAIQNNFREEDYVCRFGGDEFTVIMVHATSAMRSLVEAKIESIRETLRNTSDGLPVITLSIGVAFSDRPDPTDDILKDADTALYSVKRTIRCSCAVYGPSYQTSMILQNIPTTVSQRMRTAGTRLIWRNT